MTSNIDLHNLTRRKFVKAAGATTAGLMLSGPASASSEPDRMFEHGSPLKEFGYGDVRFAPGAHQAQLEQTHSVLMGLNEDSLLRPFRLQADLPAPGFELGGWYSSNDRDPGHSFGQWISALSRYYAITRDDKTKEKIFRLLQGYGATVEPSGKFFKNYPGSGNASEASYTYGMLRQMTPASPEWRSRGVRFLPWWIVKDEIYTAYHDVDRKA